MFPCFSGAAAGGTRDPGEFRIVDAILGSGYGVSALDDSNEYSDDGKNQQDVDKSA